MGDRFFDLANFSINHELDATQSEALLEAYFGGVRPADVEALELMRFMSDFREAMWGVVQSAVSELDFDFDSYAAEHFERLERTAASPAFVAALGLNERGAPGGAPRSWLRASPTWLRSESRTARPAPPRAARALPPCPSAPGP